MTDPKPESEIAAFAHQLRLARYGCGRGQVGHTQGMLLNGKLQLVHGGNPLRTLFKECAGTQFAYAILKTARGHSWVHGTNGPIEDDIGGENVGYLTHCRPN